MVCCAVIIYVNIHYLCSHKRPLRPEIRVDKFIKEKDKEQYKHALVSSDEDDSSDDDFDLIITKEVKPQTEMEDVEEDEQVDEDNEDDEDEEIEPIAQSPSIEENKSDEMIGEGKHAESEEEKIEERQDEANPEETVDAQQEKTTLPDTFNEPLIGQTLTVAPIDDATTEEAVAEDNSEDEEASEETANEPSEEDLEEKKRKEAEKKEAVKRYILQLREEEREAQAYMSDECEEEDDHGNVLSHRTMDDMKHLNDEELGKEIEEFIAFDSSDEEENLNKAEVESEVTHFSDEDDSEDDASMRLMDDSDEEEKGLHLIGSSNRKIIKREYNPQMLKEQLEKNQETLKLMKRKDGGYGQFSSRGSRLLNATLNKFALPPTSLEVETSKLKQQKERKEVESKKKEAEKRQVEAYRNALKKRKRELESQEEDSMSVHSQSGHSTRLETPTPSFANSQELLSIFQNVQSSSQQPHTQRQTKHDPKSSFLNKTNQKAKQFAAREEKRLQKKSKEAISVFSLPSSTKEKPKKKKKTSKK